MNSNKVIILIAVFTLYLTALNAQNRNKDLSIRGDWLFHLGVNVVGDGGDSVVGNVLNKDFANFSNPLAFGVEYFYKENLSFTGIIAFNKYLAGIIIDNTVILDGEEANYLAIDFATRYHFLKPSEKNSFEPYLLLGLGYTRIDGYVTTGRTVPAVGRITINAGFGANYWITNSVGLNLTYKVKYGLKLGEYKEFINNQAQLFIGVYYSNNKKFTWR